jgi:hypothetical protein
VLVRDINRAIFAALRAGDFRGLADAHGARQALRGVLGEARAQVAGGGRVVGEHDAVLTVLQV